MKRIDHIPRIKELGLNAVTITQSLVNDTLTHEEKQASEVNVENLKLAIQVFVAKLKTKLRKCNNTWSRFLKKEEEWLQGSIQIEEKRNSGGPGRPEKKWEEYGERSKRYKVNDLAENHPEALALAAAKSAKLIPGKTDFTHVVKLCAKSDSTASEIRKSMEKKNEPKMMTPEDALSLKVHCDLSDDQYQIIRNSSIIQNANIYPTLHKLFESKSKCYPNQLNISETSAECTLQNMVNRVAENIECEV